MTKPISHPENPSAKSEETTKLIDAGHEIPSPSSTTADYVEDKRESARHEHTNHFTNRAPQSQK